MIVNLYGIEAEIPENCPMIVMTDSGDACICDCNGGDVPPSHCRAVVFEVFAACALGRWDDIMMSERNENLVAHAEEQMEKWRAIRAAAIEEEGRGG